MASSIYNAVYNTIQSFRGFNTTFLTDEDVPGCDLTGKWAIISGANNGIGLEAAKVMAACGANLVLGCRRPPPWELQPAAAVEERVAEAAKNGHNSSTIEYWELDMADLGCVEAFCRRWQENELILDILCNNAGVAVASKPSTKDGFSWVHQVNFLSHVLLTLRLLPSLARSSEPRIVCTTSCVHHIGQFDLDYFNAGDGTDYQNNKLYFQMWLAEMQSRFLQRPEYRHVTINGVNPGYVASGLYNTVEDAAHGGIGGILLKKLAPYVAITSQQGGLAIVHAATSPDLAPDPQGQNTIGSGHGGGKYINRIWEAPAHPYCGNREDRLRLWDNVDQELHLSEKRLLF